MRVQPARISEVEGKAESPTHATFSALDPRGLAFPGGPTTPESPLQLHLPRDPCLCHLRKEGLPTCIPLESFWSQKASLGLPDVCFNVHLKIRTALTSLPGAATPPQIWLSPAVRTCFSVSFLEPLPPLRKTVFSALSFFVVVSLHTSSSSCLEAFMDCLLNDSVSVPSSGP